MKKIVIGIIVISTFFVSCKDWLTVKPFDALEQGEVFLTERNANSALNGIYLSLAMDNLYAKEMTCGMLEVLAQHYIVPSQASPVHPYFRLNSYSYSHDDAKKKLANTFKAAYMCIADCNEFIAQVELSKEQFTNAKYNIYIGEAIAIRTLLHFDMLRLFGPIGTELERESVPYYDVSTFAPQPILVANDLIDILIGDIDTAIEYLSKDAILQTGTKEHSGIADFFNDFRNVRMNYFAANALKARMCLYKGTPESLEVAYEIASNLITDKDPVDPSKSTNFNSCFKFIKTTSYQVYPEELIFTLNNSKRDNVNRTLFSTDLDNTALLGCGASFLGYLYGIAFGTATTANSAPGGMDPGPRGKIFDFESIRNLCTFKRYYVSVANPNTPYLNEYQSMIRLGELYLIAAETAPTVDLKRSWIEKLRIGKGYDPGNVDGLNETQLNNLISIEFEKETYGEGQFFFYAKRKNMNLRDQNNSSVTMSRGNFVPPLPDTETYLRN